VDEKMANPGDTVTGTNILDTRKNWHIYLAVLLIAGAIYLGCIVSPPSLFDDSDAVLAQASRTMLTSGDWVTPRLDGVAYLEKPPLYYWPMVLSYKVFGVHDWSARIPIALASMGLAWLTAAMGIWAFGKRAGFYAGLCIATCVGLFLFTRALIPDVMLAFTVALSMWALLRALDEEERHPRLWAAVFAASIGTGLLIKSLIAVVFPVAAGVIYLFLTRQFFSANAWKRLHPFSGAAIALIIAAPWHVLAAIRNPPILYFGLHSGPGQYHGFLWFFFINEQLLRFLNLRYPRDYNTVPRLYFWLFHLLWLFPWSVYFPAVFKLSFKPLDRAGKMRLLALCWTGFLLVFFTFSTTQEYYSMPCYPALALLLGSAMATEGKWIRRGTYALCGVAAAAAIATLTLFLLVRNLPAPGDISDALNKHPGTYTLSLGHMGDLTLHSFAYLRAPLLFASAAFLAGAIGALRSAGLRAFLGASVMMVLFFHAARMALVVFDPYLSSRSVAEVLLRSPEGKLIIGRPYYPFSSIFFYTNRTALILNGRYNNLEYGSYEPGAPDVFIGDAEFKEHWLEPQRWYMVTLDIDVDRLAGLVGRERLNVLASSGGKSLLTNHPLAAATSPRAELLPREKEWPDGSPGAIASRRPSEFAACFGARLPVERMSLNAMIGGQRAAKFSKDKGTYSWANHVYCSLLHSTS
jgi:4-amino-4-deoxy-L-arabinose transferase-like glycosyltransferase